MKRFIDWDKIFYTIIIGLFFALIIVCFFSSVLPEIPPKIIFGALFMFAWYKLVRWKNGGGESW